VIVTGVVVVTAFVGMEIGWKRLPSPMFTLAGGTTRSELLLRVTVAPSAGALPFSEMFRGARLPPVVLFGEGRSSFSDGGCTLIGKITLAPP
jgi:hypothetical protein